MLNTIVIVLEVISALFLIITILLHSGRGSGLSDMFGGTTTLSGGTALERTLDSITVVTAVVFGLCTFWLAWKWNPCWDVAPAACSIRSALVGVAELGRRARLRA